MLLHPCRATPRLVTRILITAPPSPTPTQSRSCRRENRHFFIVIFLLPKSLKRGLYSGRPLPCRRRDTVFSVRGQSARKVKRGLLLVPTACMCCERHLARACTSRVYSSRDSVTSSGIPAASTSEAPTLDAIFTPRSVTMGTPAHSASQPTVWALYSWARWPQHVTGEGGGGGGVG